MKTEYKVQNNLQIRTKLNIPTMQFLTYKNYILSVFYEGNTVDFYNMKNFKKEFYLKRNRHENNFYHEKWKLFLTKNHKAFLLGYKDEPEEAYNDNDINKKLDIYLLKIGQRKCFKRAAFTYYKFTEDRKYDKLYILTDNTIIQYDFITGTSNEKNISIKIPELSRWSKFFLIGNYFLIVCLREVSKWIFLEYCNIIDKDLEHKKEFFCHLMIMIWTIIIFQKIFLFKYQIIIFLYILMKLIKQQILFLLGLESMKKFLMKKIMIILMGILFC